MRIIVCKDYENLSKKAAQMIMSQITLKPNSVIGLATGSTPLGMYKELIKLFNLGLIDFSKVTTFNLDEYYSLPKENIQSYHYYMFNNLFNNININPENINIPNGMCENIDVECSNYDNKIHNSGGIDIQVLGIGRNAHIGFNEPTLNFECNAHLVNLRESTIDANSRFFKSMDEVPKQAITMGTGSIFKAKKIILLANGLSKADAIYNTIYGKITPEVPSSILQFHDDIIFILDSEAASKLNPDDCEFIPQILY